MLKEIKVDIDITPYDLAKEFGLMYSDDQAEFFNELARLLIEYGKPFAFHFRYVIDSGKLTRDGIRLMREIGKYGESADLHERTSLVSTACSR